MAFQRFVLAAASSTVAWGDTIRVAVLEHRVQIRSMAAETMQANLEIYEEQIKAAAQRGAKLLVTPEDGITGYPGNQRAMWWDYAAALPEAGRAVGTLCDEAAVFWPLKRLSCMAQQYQVAVVASLVDMKDCRKEPQYPGCSTSRDGWLLLNTAVVLDRDGRLLQKYHKANLWFEAALDESKECSPKNFSIKGFEDVTFGIFICADLIHAWPPLELVKQGVRHFVMPLSWTNEMAQMQPEAWQQAWSFQMKSVLLAANTRAGNCTGSGIFVQGEAKALAWQTADDQLLVDEVPRRLPGPAATPEGCPSGGASPQPLKAFGAQWQSFQLNMTPGEHSSTVCSAWQPGFASGSTCCRVSYRSWRAGRGYAVAVLNGLDVSPQVAPWAAEACAVLPCRNDGNGDCLTYPSEELQIHGADWFGEFESLALEVNFSTTQEVLPQVLSSSKRLLPPSAWHLQRMGSRSWRMALESSDLRDLVSFQLYGRPYWKDSDAQQHCPCSSRRGVLV